MDKISETEKTEETSDLKDLLQKDMEMEWLTKRMNSIKLESESNIVGFCFDEKMLLHKDFSNAHYECPERAMVIYTNLINKGLINKLKRIPINEIDKDLIDKISKIHSLEYIEKIESLNNEEFINKTGYRLLYDTYDNYFTSLSAKASVAGILGVSDSILKGEIKNGFAIIRPPGHHAFNNECSGFCFYNNVAIASKYLKNKFINGKEIKKIAIVDWDVHHGNGTQDLFISDDSVLFISLHRYDNGKFYPYKNCANYTEIGHENGKGYNINIPWNTYNKDFKVNMKINDDDYISAFELIVKPILNQFSPDFILVSCGFDAAEYDPLGGLCLSPFAYHYMTCELTKINKHVLIALEGGYNLDSLKRCSEGIIKGLLNEDFKDLDYNAKKVENLNNYSNNGIYASKANDYNDYIQNMCFPNKYIYNDLIKYKKSFSKHWTELLNHKDYFNKYTELLINKNHLNRYDFIEYEKYILLTIDINQSENFQIIPNNMIDKFMKEKLKYGRNFRITSFKNNNTEFHDIFCQEYLDENSSLNLIGSFLSNINLNKSNFIKKIEEIVVSTKTYIVDNTYKESNFESNDFSKQKYISFNILVFNKKENSSDNTSINNSGIGTRSKNKTFNNTLNNTSNTLEYKILGFNKYLENGDIDFSIINSKYICCDISENIDKNSLYEQIKGKLLSFLKKIDENLL